MANINDDYLYKTGLFKLDVLLDDNFLQELINENESDPSADLQLIEVLRLLVKYDLSGIKNVLNKEYFTKHHMTNSETGWIEVSPSLKNLVNRFEPIPRGYPQWFILFLPDVILWASYNEGREIISKWIVQLEKQNEIEIIDEEAQTFTIYILEEMIKKYLAHRNKLECSRLRM
jgi:hypothetical protein